METCIPNFNFVDLPFSSYNFKPKGQTDGRIAMHKVVSRGRTAYTNSMGIYTCLFKSNQSVLIEGITGTV